MSFYDEVTTGTYSFVSLVVKIILFALALSLSLPFADKIQYFVHSSFNSILQLINGIFCDFLKLLKYRNSAAIVALFKIPLGWFGAGWATDFPKNLALYLKDSK